MFDTVLVANRGEIAVRVIRTLRAHGHPLGRRLHRRRRRRAARRARPTSPSGSGRRRRRRATCRSTGVLDAAAAHRRAGRSTPATASCPRTPRSPRPARRPGIVFVGPPRRRDRGDGRQDPRQADGGGGRACRSCPGRTAPGLDDADAGRRPPTQVGFPVLLKPSRGRRRQGHARGAPRGRAAPRRSPRARREARGAFGDDTLLVERLRRQPRGTSRSRCSPTPTATWSTSASASARLQRRHQKIIEEAPSPLLDAEHAGGDGRARRSRRRGRSATPARARSSSSSTATGRDDVLLPGDEHPAAGRAPGHRAGHRARPGRAAAAGRRRRAAAARPGATSPLDGHAIEARVYAEDPARGFLPAGRHGPRAARAAGAGVRVDSGARRWARSSAPTTTRCWPRSSPGRRPGRRRCAGWTRALGRHRRCSGSTPTSAFLRALLADPDVRRRAASTPGWSSAAATALTARRACRRDVVRRRGRCALLAELRAGRARSSTRWDVPDGWRLGEPAWTVRRLQAGRRRARCEVRARAGRSTRAAEVAASAHGDDRWPRRAPSGTATGSTVDPATG